MRVVLATSNRGKLEELAGAFPRWNVHGLSEYPGIVMPEETGDTFEENARIKAVAVCEATGHPALADDSGLCVDALGGAPGVRSARFAGEGAGDAANRTLLRERMDTVEPARRGAKFVCALALAMPDGRMDVVRAECAGTILRVERGTGGFGYDPLFVPEGETRTFAQMSVAEKEELSHRGHAIRLAREKFARWLGDAL